MFTNSLKIIIIVVYFQGVQGFLGGQVEPYNGESQI